MASKVEICNRALQKLGAKRIISLDDNSVNARACNTAYDPLRLRELRVNNWTFAILRASLPADVPAPAFGPTNSFTLPSDFIRLVRPDTLNNFDNLDWILENKKILTYDSAPLQIRYVSDVKDPNAFDPLFREALSSKMAYELCEELTQSNVKKKDMLQDYKEAISEARKTNGIEKPADSGPDDLWITVRAYNNNSGWW